AGGAAGELTVAPVAGGNRMRAGRQRARAQRGNDQAAGGAHADGAAQRTAVDQELDDAGRRPGPGRYDRDGSRKGDCLAEYRQVRRGTDGYAGARLVDDLAVGQAAGTSSENSVTSIAGFDFM